MEKQSQLVPPINEGWGYISMAGLDDCPFPQSVVLGSMSFRSSAVPAKWKV